MIQIDQNILNKIRDHLKDLSHIEENNLDDRLMTIPKHQHELFIRYVHESKHLGNTELKMKKLYGELYKYYKYNDDRNWDTKGEIESQIYADPKYQVLWREFNEQKYIVEELEGFLNNLKSLYYNIKEFIGLLKFQAGMF